MKTYTDKERLDFLNNNHFHREKDSWDSRFTKGDMWVIFSPEGARGDFRDKIDAMMDVYNERTT
jgi:hypothetical protein